MSGHMYSKPLCEVLKLLIFFIFSIFQNFMIFHFDVSSAIKAKLKKSYSIILGKKKNYDKKLFWIQLQYVIFFIINYFVLKNDIVEKKKSDN